MIVLKTWQLRRKIFDENDLRWCRGLNITVNIETNMQDFIIYGSASNFKVVRDIHVKITTSTEKQEMAIFLKYGDDLVLLEERIVNVKL